MSTTLRQCTLRFLKALGINQFRSDSGLGLPFIVHLGDSFGEMPYYNLQSHCAEINLMAAWCRQVENPLILDVGGHVGFIATQLAQLLANKKPLIYSFEPVPYMFKRLFESVRALGMEHTIVPVCAACSNEPGLVQLSYSEWDSMFAQVFVTTPNRRVGDKTALATALTIDQIAASLGKVPDLIKVDAEGHEVNILEGGREVLACPSAPALCFEFNPANFV
jgi:FkbM family methyltransferase